MDCPTRQGKTLDHCYTTIEGAYRATPRAPLGNSHHALLVLIPVYKQKLKTVRTVSRSVRRWSQDAIENLQGCLDCTDWDIFKYSCSSLDEYTDTVTSYISFCENVCVPLRKVRKFGNDKPWFSGAVKAKIAAKNEAFKAGDRAKYSLAKSGVQREIRRAKARYRNKIEAQLTTNNTREVWRGLQCVTRYKLKEVAPSEVSPDLPDQLNNFYCRFDDKNPDPGYRPSLPDDPVLLTPPFTVQVHEVKRLFMKQNTKKASGPDGVSAYALRSCAVQLAPGIYRDL